MDSKGNVLLISFYNPKSLGLRYLENALTHGGYRVKVVFFKNFNSVNPKRATDAELKLMRGLIEDYKPMMIGLSVMATHYLETVEILNKDIRTYCKAPIVWGGVYATMFPEKCMQTADYVIRGEGEEAVIELADYIAGSGHTLSEIKNLVYISNNEIIINELAPLSTDLDRYGIPTIGGDKCMIENDALSLCDPQIKALSYELSASRGCPYGCTYCCSVNLSRIHSGKGKYVRFRTVDNVLDELHAAKKQIKNLKVIHFWDEVFCDDEKWVEEFSIRYKKEINLPFEIWGHPLKTEEHVIAKLRNAGLYKVVMGIQSGSPHIRKDIFRRPEKQEDIIKASKVLVKCGVPQIIYDFMLRHPFETAETIKESYDLVKRLARPFELQMHGLNFLPGTDIVQMAIDAKLISPEDMDRLMTAPIEEQYNMHWKIENQDKVMNFWYKLIFITQFPFLRGKGDKLAKGGYSEQSDAKLDKLCRLGKHYSKFRYLHKKGIIVLKGTLNFR